MATPIKENTAALEDLLDLARALPSVPGSVEQAAPIISVSSGGLITASATQTAGVVAAGTKSETKQLPTKGATTITPSENVQTAVSAGTYVTGDIKVAAQSGGVSVQTKKGSFTTVKSSEPGYMNGKAEVDCGFVPDLFVITIVEDPEYSTQICANFFGKAASEYYVYSAANAPNYDDVFPTNKVGVWAEAEIARFQNKLSIRLWVYELDYTEISGVGLTFSYEAYKFS